MLSLSACVDDWGQQDPIGGSQKFYPDATLATYDFESEETTPFFIPSQGESGSLPSVGSARLDEEEVDYYGQVMNLNGGSIEIDNPFKGNVGEVAALTFYVRRAPIYNYVYDDEGVVSDSSAVVDAYYQMLSWATEDGAQILTVNPNGTVNLYAAVGTVELASTERPTGAMMPQDAWHWVAMQFDTEGYTLYVDGNKRIHETPTDFDCSKILEFLNNADHINFYSNCSNISIDQLTFYAKALANEQEKDPRVIEDTGEEVIDPYFYVGQPDYSSPWWTDFSEQTWQLEMGETFHTKFTNYNSGGTNNYENWLIVATNGPDSHGGGGSEYFVLRADAYGWGNGDYDASNMYSEFDWSTFISEMNGAVVDMTVTYKSDSRVYVDAEITSSSNKHYTYTYNQAVSSDVVGLFFLVEKAYLVFESAETWVGQAFESGTHLVGPADCSAGWWSEFSDYFTYTGDFDKAFKFINNQTGSGANWNNWLLAAATTERGGDGYAEYFVLRSDAYGWGDSNYSADGISASFDWDSYVKDMHGATCYVRIQRSGSTFTMTNYTRKTDGTWLPPYTFEYNGMTGQSVTLWFLVEAASLDMLVQEGTWAYWDQIPGYWGATK